MQMLVRRSIISGTLSAPASNALAHRALIIASIAGEQSLISNLPRSKYTEATISACRSLGADILVEGDTADIFGAEELSFPSRLDCGESNSALKLLMPLACVYGDEVTFTGTGQLSGKSLSPFALYLERLGATTVSENGYLPLKLRGPLTETQMIYSHLFGTQFLSGLMISLPLRPEDSEIGLEGSFSGMEYLEGTKGIMEKAGVTVDIEGGELVTIEGRQAYSPIEDYAVPGSRFLSTFPLLAGALAGNTEVKGTGGYPELERLLESFGAVVRPGANSLCASVGEIVRAEYSAQELGPLLPHAFVLAAFGREESKFTGIRALGKGGEWRARLLAGELSKMGANFTETEAGFFISGGKLSGAEVDPSGDAHVAMALAAAAVASAGSTTIKGAECVEGSYPGFFRDLARIGALVRQ